MNPIRMPLVPPLLLAAACGGGPPATGAFEADGLPALAIDEELRIGSVDDPDLGFSQIGGVRVAPDGEVYVLERMQREIRVYDEAGRLLRSFGRQGGGPGEFEFPSSFGLVGDTLWVNDFRNRRITLFTRAGELLGTIATTGVPVDVGIPDFRVTLYPGRPRADGLFTSGFSFGIMPDPPVDSFRVPQVLFDAKGAIVDTMGWETRAMPPPMVRVGTVMFSALPALQAGPIRIETDGDSVVVERPVADGPGEAEFAVARIRAGGDTVFHRRFRYVPRAVDAAFEDSLARSRVTPFLRGRTDTAAMIREIRGTLNLPPYHPPIMQTRMGSDGAVWLRREGEGDEVRWIVVGADGTVRGVVRVAPGTAVLWSDRDRMWVSERDDFDVPWLVRYRLRGG